jgi:hypothetical protein
MRWGPAFECAPVMVNDQPHLGFALSKSATECRAYGRDQSETSVSGARKFRFFSYQTSAISLISLMRKIVI